jgi:hypothetical protein
MSETKFHTYTELQEKLQSCMLQFVSFSTADEKTEGCELNGSEYYQNSISN